jgi:hypothetical protein
MVSFAVFLIPVWHESVMRGELTSWKKGKSGTVEGHNEAQEYLDSNLLIS